MRVCAYACTRGYCDPVCSPLAALLAGKPLKLNEGVCMYVCVCMLVCTCMCVYLFVLVCISIQLTILCLSKWDCVSNSEERYGFLPVVCFDAACQRCLFVQPYREKANRTKLTVRWCRITPLQQQSGSSASLRSCSKLLLI
jgi:hypothetical protein